MKQPIGTLIHAYSRERAIRDGVLVDVTDTAREAGFVFPVAVTSRVWAECVRVPDGVTGQDESGRLWDVLMMLRFAIRGTSRESELRYRLYVATHEGAEPVLVELKAVCGPDDDGGPCLTVMCTDED